jgi:hypothetical protein
VWGKAVIEKEFVGTKLSQRRSVDVKLKECECEGKAVTEKEFGVKL